MNVGLDMATPTWLRELSGLGGYNPDTGETAYEERQRREREARERAAEGLADLGLSDDAKRLRSTRQQYDDKLLTAQVAGVEDDGAEAPGLLSKVLGYLQNPKDVVVGAVSGLAGWDTPNEKVTDRSLLGRLGAAGSRAWRYGTDDEQTIGMGEFDALRFQDDDGWAERGAKALGAFAGDVALDPLTYVTLGGSVLGRKAASEAVEAAGRNLATDALGGASDDVVRGLTRGTDDAVLRKQLFDRFAQARPSTTMDDLAERSTDDLLDELGGLGVDTRDLAEQGFANRMAGSYLARGASGLRRDLREWLGDDAGERIFDRLPNDIQGGVRFQSPLRRATGGLREPDALRRATGGGKVLPEPVLDLGHAARSRMRTSWVGQRGLAATGRAGIVYAGAVKSVHEGTDGGHAYSVWSAYRKALQKDAVDSRVADDAMKMRAAEVHHLMTSTDGATAEQVREAATIYGNLRGRLDEVGGSVDHLPEPARAAGQAVAGELEQALDEVGTEARRLLGDDAMGWLNSYVPRVMTDEERALRSTTLAGRRGRGGSNPVQSRTGVYADWVADEDGVLRPQFWSPLEVAKAEGRNVFETDPIKYTVEYVDRLRGLLRRERLFAALDESGVLAFAGSEASPGFVRSPKAAAAAQKALDEQTAAFERYAATGDRDELRAALKRLRPDEQVPEGIDAAREQVLSAVLQDRARVSALLGEGFLNVPEDELTRRLADLSEVVGRWTSQAPAKVRDDLLDRRAVQSRYATWLREQGWEDFTDPTTQRAVADRLDQLGAFAPGPVVESMERLFRSRVGSVEMDAFVDGFWKPYLSLWKAWATVGRGPGYVSRNVVGGVWNAWLAGVGSEHWTRAARIRLASRTVRQRAEQELIKAGADVTPRTLLAKLEKLGPAVFAERLGDQGASEWAAYKAFVEQGLGESNAVEDALTVGSRSGVVRQQPGATRKDADLRRLAGERNLFSKPWDELTGVQRVAQRGVDNIWMRWWSGVAGESEGFLRLGSFLKGVDDWGLDDGGVAASLTVKGTQFDYGDLSDFELRILRNMIPFYTWSRRNLPLQFRATISEPSKVLKLERANEQLARLFGEDQDDPDAGHVLPQWVRERMGWVTPWSFGESPLVGMMESPALDLNQWLTSDGPGPFPVGIRGDQIVNSLNPFAKTAIETATGVSTFTRAPFVEEEAPAWARIIPGLTHEADGREVVNARWTNVVRQLAPPIGQAERLLPGIVGSPRYEDRALTNWLTQEGVPSMTLTPRQERAELLGRMDRLDAAVERDVDREGAVTTVIGELLEAGWSPAEVAAFLESRGLRAD